MLKRIWLSGLTSGSLMIISMLLISDYQLKSLDDPNKLKHIASISLGFQVGILVFCVAGGLWLVKIGNKGLITFSQCVVYGILIAVISGSMSGAFSYYYNTRLHPEVLESSKQYYREQMMRMPNQTPAKVMEEQLDSMYSPAVNMGSNVLISIFIAIIVSAITGAFIHRHNPREETLL